MLALASERARTLFAAAGGGPEAERSAALNFAADALTGVMLESKWPPEPIAEMTGRVSLILDEPSDSVSLELFIRASSNPRLLELPPLLTVELQLRLLLALSPITEVSLWEEDSDRQLRCVGHAGEAAPTRRVRAIVRSVLDGTDDEDANQRNRIHGMPVLRWQQPHAALVGRADPNDRLRTRAFLQEAARCAGPVLEREMLLERAAEREKKLAEASERHLMRLGFDLHDGPLQDLAALSMDVQDARAEITHRISMRSRRLVGGRLDDLHAQIQTLEDSLRDLAGSLQPASILERPLPEVLRREVDKFGSRGHPRVTLELGGDFEGLTDSQRITIYRIVQEGLSNVRDHSAATDVRVMVDGRSGADQCRDRGQRQGLPRRADDDPRGEERTARARRDRRARAAPRRAVRPPQPGRRAYADQRDAAALASAGRVAALTLRLPPAHATRRRGPSPPACQRRGRRACAP